MVATSTIYIGYVDGLFKFSIVMGGILLIVIIIVKLTVGILKKF